MKNKWFLTVIVVVFGLFTACGDQGEDPNEPDPGSKPSYTVDFEANGGAPAPSQQTVVSGQTVVTPPAMGKSDYGFSGWYKEAALTNQWNFNSDVVTGNITLYAKWEPATVVPGANWNAKMRWMDANVQRGGAYIIEFDSDESISPITFSYSGKNNISITMKGIGSMRTLSLSANGSMFTVGSGITLILADNLELRGQIHVNSGGNLILNHGARITGNSAAYYSSSSSSSSSYGGGVYVAGGTFTMSGGEISGNQAIRGGGVYMSGGTFTMSGGKISGNRAFATLSSSSFGGGVYVAEGTFTMSGGEISGNTASSTSSSSAGGGVYAGGTFTMSGGEISGNTASGGGGVYMSGGTGTSFTMSGGEISGNTASSSGGGVYMSGIGTSFTMSGGEISGNTASSGGGGVDMSNGTFTMSGGEISGNTASFGGGVCMSGGTGTSFTMSGGEISGNTASSYGGGGVYLYYGTFTMRGGEISGNTASGGGGVYMSSGTFTMRGGEISGNTASSYNDDPPYGYGGGVYISDVSLSKTGGTIFGYSSGNSKSNVVKDIDGVVQNNKGHAVYVHHRNPTYDGMGKDSTSGPGDNLSFNGTDYLPTPSGGWDY